MSKFALVAGVCFFLAACTDTPSTPGGKPSEIARGVDSATRQDVDSYYTTEPDCSNPGYPEVRIVRGPDHGAATTKTGEVYPNFSKDNVRFECNRKKVAATIISYESAAGFHGKDSFTVQVRYSTSALRLVTYKLDVI